MAVIIDYDAGNLRSVQRACAQVGLQAQISAEPEVVTRAERVIFPGVGAAGSAMRSLTRNGMDVALRETIAAGVPVLGICLDCRFPLTIPRKMTHGLWPYSMAVCVASASIGPI